MHRLTSCLGAIAALALASSAAIAAEDTKIALVPGGPHPYFAAWEQAGKDAAKDFRLGAADYKRAAEMGARRSRTSCSRACSPRATTPS